MSWSPVHMTNSLDRYFETELAALLAAGTALSGKDAIGRRLRISRDYVADPHVERLLEGVAYLGARVQARLDDEFPELTDALLGMLYPHMLLPFPACLMVQFHPKADLAQPVLVPEHSPLQVVKDIAGTRCRFRTAGPVTVWPIKLEFRAPLRTAFAGAEQSARAEGGGGLAPHAALPRPEQQLRRAGAAGGCRRFARARPIARAVARSERGRTVPIAGGQYHVGGLRRRPR